MSNIALRFGTTIDQSIGDVIMVFFGDPESECAKENAVARVRMAVAMLQHTGRSRRFSRG